MAQAHTGGDAPAALTRAVESFVAAFNDLDWEPFRASFAGDATLFAPFHDVARRLEGRAAVEGFFEAYFAEVRRTKPGPPYLDIDPRDVHVRMLGTSAAVVSFHLHGPRGLGRRTLVMAEQHGEWVIVHLHASTLASTN